MDMFCLGVLAGVVFAIIVFTSGVLYGDYQREHSGNNDDIIHFSCRNGSRSGSEREAQPMDAEEALTILANFRIGASRTEREALYYVAECVHIRNRLEKFIEERGI